MSLATPETVQTLQRTLYLKAKREPAYRFYALYDWCFGRMSWPTPAR